MTAWRARRGSNNQARRPASLLRRLVEYCVALVLLMVLAALVAKLDPAETVTRIGAAVINDGDTLTLAGERIRLRGIDAPERDQLCAAPSGDYPCGRRARQELAAAVGSWPVACSGWERDRYGRLLAECRAGGVLLNALLVEKGWAVAYGDFEAEEQAAREAGRGIWAGGFERPADWRRRHGAMAEGEHDLWLAIEGWLRRIFGYAAEPGVREEEERHEAL